MRRTRRGSKRRRQGPSSHHAVVSAMVANRTHVPYSKAALLGAVGALRRFRHEAADSKHHLYRGMDYGLPRAATGGGGEAVYFKMADLMERRRRPHLLRPRPRCTRGRRRGRAHPHAAASGIRPHAQARSLEKIRPRRAPQIVMALAGPATDLPVRSWGYSGETNDVTHGFEKVKDGSRRWRPVAVFTSGDAGMTSEEHTGAGTRQRQVHPCIEMRAGDEVTRGFTGSTRSLPRRGENLQVKEE